MSSSEKGGGKPVANGRAKLLKKRESFKKQPSIGKVTSAAAASSANTKGSFEGNFFMDFYFSQGDYKLEAKKTQKEEGIAKQRTKEEKIENGSQEKNIKKKGSSKDIGGSKMT